MRRVFSIDVFNFFFVEVFVKVMNGLVMTLEEDEIFLRLAALLCEQFLPIREWKCQDFDQVLLHGDNLFFFSEQ